MQVFWSRRQASDQIVQATHLSTPHPKLKLVKVIQSELWVILSFFKGYQTAFWVCRVSHWFQKMTKSKFWYNTSQYI